MSANGSFYLDSSAYLAVILGDEGGDAIARETADAELVSSVLLMVEVERTLVRLSREGLLALDRMQVAREQSFRDRASFLFRNLTFDLCEGLVFPPASVPRSLDLVHLRTAIWFHQRRALARFITLDVQQGRAARELGLPL